MSRLLPESIKIGLFPGACWMKRGRVAPIVEKLEAGQSDGAALLAAFASLLAQLPKTGLGKVRLHLLVSDSLAAIAMLPWQEELTGEEELRTYAQACFERSGFVMDDSWAMQVGFRHFRSAGMAYALPVQWLEKLQSMCAAAGLRLETVLPVSAAAYWRQAGERKTTCHLVLLEEASRLTALTHEGGRLIARDVQPVIGDVHLAGMRLLKRVGASHLPVDAIQCWAGATPSSTETAVRACFPDARRVSLQMDVWS
ncbi:hypothetical protein [Duganella sp. S19_KUP01_CR8]|uniref:hypothetical protein n=1 Tax=Duganella sp. S19_KUP01_CR8 TaxID=3025502 RepID=UPI002FCDB823